VQESRDIWQKLSERFNANLLIIECILEPSIHKQRVKARVRNIPGIPEVTWGKVEKVKNDYLEWQEERLIIDTSVSKDQAFIQTLNYIKANIPDINFSKK
jgi:hypothetical protein